MKIFTEKRILILTSILSVATIGIILFSVFTNVPTEEVSTFSMGSYVQQTVYGATSKEAAAVAANEIAKLEDVISWRKENSDIQLLNAAAGDKSVELKPVTIEILTTCLKVAKESKGAFDPTIAPLSWLWNFDYSPTKPPEQQQIDKFTKLVDYNKLKLSLTSGLLQSEGFAVDLGAAGKGAACDAAVKIYEQQAVSGAIIAVGGSVGCFGKKPGGSNWNVAVRNPLGDGSLGDLSLDTAAFISTSGSYEKYFDFQNVRYHHLLNPKTGVPAENGLISVTVVSESGTLSDTLSTACFVLGYEEGLKLLAKFNAEAIFINEKNQISLTDGLISSFKLSSADFTLA